MDPAGSPLQDQRPVAPIDHDGHGQPSSIDQSMLRDSRQTSERPSGTHPDLQTFLPKLSDELIEFISQNETVPPRKRQKMIPEQNLPYIIVKRSALFIKLAGSKLATLEAPIERCNIKPHANIIGHRGSSDIEIRESRLRLFYTTIPEATPELEDIHLALEVDREYENRRSWTKGQGRLWTEFDLALQRKDGSDFLMINFTVKWNITTSPSGISQATAKTRAVSSVLARYFPDPKIIKGETWSPQDFYQSVHTPAKNEEASSLRVDVLESDLYPFQKRAVQWMLQREGVAWGRVNARVSPVPASQDTTIPDSFLQGVDAEGQTCYVSHLLGLVTWDTTPFAVAATDQEPKGGILAEEMGLGKTVELISLIILHKRPKEDISLAFDALTEEKVRPISATLIITPASILQQWKSEINKHAPQIRVVHYEGVKSHFIDASDLLEKLAAADVVLTTYSVLTAEISFTKLNPEKKLRRPPTYQRPKSALMQLQWWRVCIDEAQMIESGVSKAAIVARMIPRVNAWCVTGTPVRKEVVDLLGLLIFLRYEPYASIKHIWSDLISSHKHEFRSVFGRIALRHSKRSVRDEVKLPAQRRYVITMPFTPIEEQHYQELFNQMCDESGLDAQGAPLTDIWDPNSVSDIMGKWLLRLRQTTLHPEIGGKNRRALGYKDGPLRTVDQVLEVMMDQADVSIRIKQRTLLMTKLKRGQLYENSPRVREALEIWEGVVVEASESVEELREQLQQELNKSQADEKVLGRESSIVSVKELNDTSDEQEEIESSSRLGVLRNRLRASLEILHMAIFFRANAFFQIKSNEAMTKPDSEEFQKLDKLEADGYEEAKRLRREILNEVYRKADKLMRILTKKAATQVFIQVPEFPTAPPRGGLESRRLMEQLDVLATALDVQANTLDEWREKSVQLLVRQLVDEDEGAEITGDEFEVSTRIQDKVLAYVQALRALVSDRHFALTGQENNLVASEVKTAIHLAGKGQGPAPGKLIKLFHTRQQIKPREDMGSLRGIVGEFRALATSLRYNAEDGDRRAQNELSIVEKQLSFAQKQFAEQIKANNALEKEIELFTRVMNTRLEYYRQLQQISDMVQPYDGPNTDRAVAKMLEAEDRLSIKIAIARAKRRYLLHLQIESSSAQEQRICVICQESFEIGALTVCGHQYCKECIQLWWTTHHNCPVCKRRLIKADLYDITYKPQMLSVQTEDVHNVHQKLSSPTASSRNSAIYTEISKSQLNEIKTIELDGPSFTTKVDTLARHLIWLRQSDPGAQSVVFSQFKEFLDVLALAFARFKISFSSIDKGNGIEKFKKDPTVECFLLHARAHSSGLNLVNARHVFLCEPLLNTALELQAIARVDRIGQQQETNVWLYLIDGTVEESIHQLSVKRRKEHIGERLSKHKGKAKELIPDELLVMNLEEANSMELQQASLSGLMAKGGKSGEMVGKEDLWDCLFGGVGPKRVNLAFHNSSLRDDPEVVRHLRAEAAEERQSVADV